MLLSVIRNIGVLEGGDMAEVMRRVGTIAGAIVMSGSRPDHPFFIRFAAPVILLGYGR
jgi:predicted GTPase